MPSPQLELAVDDIPAVPTATLAASVATAIPVPELNTTAAAIAAPSPTPCLSDVVYVADLTVPDNTVVAPSAPIDKQWQVRNTGDCAWTNAYRIIFSEGSLMNAAVEHAVYPAKPGGEATVQIAMIAPDVPGEYRGYWQFVDRDGQPFGQRLYIQIVVGE